MSQWLCGRQLSENIRAELAKLESVLKNIVREKDEDTSVTMDKIRSIALQILHHRNPGADEKTKESRLTNMITVEISHFISDKASPAYKECWQKLITKYSENPSLSTICEKVQELEVAPGCALQADKTNDSRVSDHDLYELIGDEKDRSDQQEYPVNVFDSRQRKPYIRKRQSLKAVKKVDLMSILVSLDCQIIWET